MSAHLSSQQVEQYRRHLMSPAELLETDEHLLTCESCRGQVADPEQVEAAFLSLRRELGSLAQTPQEHLTYEQLAAYVDDRLNEVDREIVLSHTSVCARCKEEARELFAFRDTLSTAQSPVTAQSQRARLSLGERIGDWWGRPKRILSMPMLGAMAALLFFALIVVWLARRPERDPQLAIVQPSPSPVLTPSPAPSVAPSIQGNTNGQTANENTNPKQTPGPSPSPPVVNPPAENPSPLLALNDGGQRVALDGRGNLEGLEALPKSEREAVRSALALQRLERPAGLADVTAKGGTLMGSAPEGEAFSLQGPAGVILDAERPTFRWSALAGASQYVVKVYDTNFQPVAASDPLSSTTWTPRQPLERGKIYTWQVLATKEGREVLAPAPPAPEARFKILDSRSSAELARSLQASQTSHLARGVLYARAGLLDEAEREFAALLKENPQSPVARKLLNNLRAMRRAR